MEEVKKLLKDILVLETLILSNQLAEEAKAKGRQRVGGDFTSEAASLLRQKRASVLQKMT
jgi:hypothetical protein